MKDSEDPTVYFEETDKGFRLIRNEKPFYIKGGAAHPDYLKELAEAGANTARIYDTINLAQSLDKAEALGLAVVVDIPLPSFGRDPQFYEDEFLFRTLAERVKKTVKIHKDHKALLYWNLGNELLYPTFYKRTKFFSQFNVLINLIHEIDPNHPVSTAVIAGSRKRLGSILIRSPNLDFISLNSFGSITGLKESIESMSLFWKGPYVISEWGINGPWEETKTSWEARIEPTSTKKAEILRERYNSEVLRDGACLGSFVFYWGKKNEVTSTWFSLFGEDGKKTQAVFELTNIWKNREAQFPGPQLDYILLNEKGAKQNVILSPGSKAKVDVVLPENKPLENLNYRWEIRHESWYDFHISKLIDGINFTQSGTTAVFNVPEEEGPYRLFLYITNETEYIATANIPFYVLKPEDGK